MTKPTIHLCCQLTKPNQIKPTTVQNTGVLSQDFFSFRKELAPWILYPVAFCLQSILQNMERLFAHLTENILHKLNSFYQTVLPIPYNNITNCSHLGKSLVASKLPFSLKVIVTNERWQGIICWELISMSDDQWLGRGFQSI